MKFKKPNIRRARHALGLTLEEFARMVGTSYTTVWRWENGSPGRSLAYAFATRIAARKVSALRRDRRKVQGAAKAGNPLTALIRAALLYDPKASF